MSRWLGCLVALAALLSACSRHGLPSDFAVYRGDGFSVGYPSAWEGCHGNLPFAGSEEPAAEFSGPAGKNQIVPPVIQVANEGTKRTFEHALRFHRLLLQVNPGYKQLAEEEVNVPGAKKAVRIEFEQEYPLPVPRGRPQLHGVNILAEGRDGSVVSLLISATVPDFERLKKTFDDAVRSLAVGSEVAGPDSPSRPLPDCSQPVAPTPSPTASA